MRRYRVGLVAIGGLATVLAVAAVAVATPNAPLPGYRIETVWPANIYGLPAPNNIATGLDGRVWILDGSAGQAVAVAPDGTLSERRSVPQDALDLAPEPGGDLFLGRYNPRPARSEPMTSVARYDRSGRAVWVRACDCGSGSGIAASAGRVWLTEPGGHAITWLGSVDGRVSGQVSARAAANGFPADVAVAPDGTIFATDLIGDAVYAWPSPYLPADVATWSMLEATGPFRIGVGAQADGAPVVAVLFSDGLVRVHRPDGTLVARFFVPGEPLDLAVGEAARIYVLDEVSHDVRVYVPGAPPTATPVPVDPPLGPSSCQIAGSRTLNPSTVTRCGTTQVTLRLDALCPPDAVAGADVALVIDHSQSMRKGTPKQIDAARAAAKRFLNGLDFRYHQVAIVSFNDLATVDQPLTTDRRLLDQALDRLAPDGNGTNIYSAVRTASDHLAASGRPNALPVIVLLTDGEPTHPKVPEADTAALVAAERSRARRTYVVTIGLGTFIDSLLLESMASSPQDFYYSPSVVDLNRIYDSILRVVQSLNLTDLVVEDTPARPFTRYVAGSGSPPPLVVNDTLTWTRPALPKGGLVFTYTLSAAEVGRGPVGRARVRYTDADGSRRSFQFPEPVLEVAQPAGGFNPGGTPGPAGGATPPPTLPPVPPVPAPPSCPSDSSWSVGIAIFPDTVGVGPYACPGCNGMWDHGDHWPLPGGTLGPATVVVSDAAGGALWVGPLTPHNDGPGRVLVHLCPPPPYTVSLARVPAGLVACPNSPTARRVESSDFGQGRYTEVRFAVWSGCGVVPSPAPTALPACPAD